jgi:hypothetical protein
MLFGFFGVECFKANGMEKRGFPLEHIISQSGKIDFLAEFQL